jgi:surface carbohydrate biosynthesis protein
MVSTRFICQIKKQLKLIFNQLIIPPKIFTSPQKCDILIFDKVGSDLFKPYLKNYRVEVLCIRAERVNIFCLMAAVFETSFWQGKLMKAYIYAYIKMTAPTLCITFIDNNPLFYEISTRFPRIKTLFVQNGIRDTFSQWLDTSVKARLHTVDYMLVFNDYIANKYLQYIKGETVVIGSFKNNSIPIKRDKINNLILFIPTYVKKSPSSEVAYQHPYGPPIYWNDYFQSEIIVLKFLKNWCQNNNKTLCLAARSIEEDIEEKEFYEKILHGSSWVTLPMIDIYSTYRHCDSAQIVVSIDSTIGYESLARGNRTAIFSCRGIALKRDDRVFGWPAKLASRGSFWTNDQDVSHFQNIMDYLNVATEEDWNKDCQDYVHSVMRLNLDNPQFKSIVHEVLSA